MSRPDRTRRVLTLAAAVGQVVLPTVLPPRFAAGAEPPDVLQPTPATFAVWLPVFGTSLAHGLFQARPGRADDPVLRAVGTPAAVAYAATAMWAPLVRARWYRSAQVALFVVAGAAEVARRRVAAAEADGLLADDVRRAVAPPTAMLAGWGAAASAVNLGALLVAEGAVPPGRPARTTGAVLALVTAGAAVTAASSARGGAATTVGRGYLATVAWALGGVAAAQRTRAPGVAVAAGVGLVPVVGALLAVRGRRATPPPSAQPSR
jgi:hypothetical protein